VARDAEVESRHGANNGLKNRRNESRFQRWDFGIPTARAQASGLSRSSGRDAATVWCVSTL